MVRNTYIDILLSLSESPKTFENILKSVNISRPTLSIKLEWLKSNGFIEKAGKRYGGIYKLKVDGDKVVCSTLCALWKLNRCVLDKTDPYVVSNLCIKLLYKKKELDKTVPLVE